MPRFCAPLIPAGAPFERPCAAPLFAYFHVAKSQHFRSCTFHLGIAKHCTVEIAAGSMSNVFDPPPFPPGAAPTISIPPEVYVYCALAVTVITLVKQYVDVIASLSTSIPKLLVIFYVIGAWGLVYLLIVVADSMLVANEAQIGSFQMIRSSLLLGAVFLVQGPYLLLPPLRKILVERGPLKHIVQGAQRKETRYVALFLFACITAAQGFVAYSLYLVISRVLEIDLAQTLGIVLAYCLVCVFYLYAFLCSMLKRSIKVAGIDPFVHFRANFTYESHGKIVNALETKAFLYLYVFSYIFIALGCFACVIYYFVIDYFAYVARGAAVDVLIIASVFFGLCILTVLCSAVFILNEAFRVVKVTVIVDLSGESDREEEFEAEEEEIAARGAPIEMEERREKAYSDDSKELKSKKSKSKSSLAVHADESVTYASAKPVPQFRVPAAPVPAGGAVMRGGSEPRREEQPSMEYSGDSLDDELEASLSNVPIIPRSTSIASWTPPPPPPISGAQLDRPPSGPPPPPPSRSQIPLPPPPTGGMASQSGTTIFLSFSSCLLTIDCFPAF